MNLYITLIGVRVNNLKNINLKIPKNQLVVFTGVSGSGKSSLAFDTIYVEGQRRYIESLPVGLKRQLSSFPKPDVDEIIGISPTIAIKQKILTKNPRSTVGTITEIYDYLRTLFARAGIPHCPISKDVVIPQTIEQVLADLKKKNWGKKIIILSPVIKKKRGALKDDLEGFLSKGFTKARIDGKIIDLSEEISLNPFFNHDLDLIIDRLSIEDETISRTREALSLAFELSNGLALVLADDQETLYSQNAYCAKSDKFYPPLEPQDFSFNNPRGMCPTCEGLGRNLETKEICPTCLGNRLKPYPAATTLEDKTIFEITQMPLDRCLKFFSNLNFKDAIFNDLVTEIKRRLEFLLKVGLHYLTLDREAPTLSGGESQRVHLAAYLGSGIVAATYILDEPSIGLHPRDSHLLLESLQDLKEAGNNVLVVEHDRETIQNADHIIDIGPDAGELGGEIVFEGSYDELLKTKNSLTADYLTGRKRIEIPEIKRKSGKTLSLEGATLNNLKNVDLEIPLETFVCITGVSGSGKSSLISDTLYPALSNKIKKTNLPCGNFKSLSGFEHINNVILVDQSPIGRTARSNPITYVKGFDLIRELFSSTPQSKAYGYDSGRFSFNVEEGTCPHCKGMGMIKIDMDFIEDEWVVCQECLGKRFDSQTLSIYYKGKNIHDVLEMKISEAVDFFKNIPSIHKKLESLLSVGLGYLKLGQPSPTLSGGEAQRVKLAKELSHSRKTNTLYILDEPTTGLHFHDIQRLNLVLQKLCDNGNSIILIEHNMDLVKTCDWVIDLGPEGGEKGGEILFRGTPEDLAKFNSPTGIALSKKTKPKKTIIKNAPQPNVIVKNARQNNLKGINAEFPIGKITVCTGPSGSGKSSFAFDTIYAEAQRRYLETLSPYARQFVEKMPKPAVDEIKNLSASIAIEQKRSSGNIKSTLGTLSEVYDYLRVLFARLGVAYSPDTGEKIESITAEFVLEKLLSYPKNTKMQILAPISIKGDSFADVKASLQKEGFLRIRLNGKYFVLDEEIPFDKSLKNELFLVIDRIVISKDIKTRLAQALEDALERANSTVTVDIEGKDFFFNLNFAEPSTGKSYPRLTPQTFSFTTPEGECDECSGHGLIYGANLGSFKELLNLSPGQLVFLLWKEYLDSDFWQVFKQFMKQFKIPLDRKIKDLPEEKIHILFFGSDKDFVEDKMNFRWRGINHAVTLLAKVSKESFKKNLIGYLEPTTCPSCDGTRINALARCVKINRHSMAEILKSPLDQVLKFINELESTDKAILEIVNQIKKRLNLLISLGLGYLSMSRSSNSLSRGETQRIHIARQLTSATSGCLYIIDEPTTGLHPDENEKVNHAIKELCKLNNTILLVEHDPLTISIADYILDFGPSAGTLGGEIIARGTLNEILKNPKSLTGQYLSGAKKIPIPATKRVSKTFIEININNFRNLKELKVKFPIGSISCVTGISGSGKSSLVNAILYPLAVKAISTKVDLMQTDYAKISGLSNLKKVLRVDQNPVGRTARADVSTYTDLLKELRFFFASLPKATAMGLTPRHFSFNNFKGMCPNCRGLGTRTIYTRLLPPTKVTCEACKGSKLNPRSLEVFYKTKNMGQILSMTVQELKEFGIPLPKVQTILDTLISVGLGYLKLNQDLNSLSGGETQRLKLSKEFGKRINNTLFILDEPTVGLHFQDIEILLSVFHKLVDSGNTIIMIEHNQDVIANSDYVLTLK